MRACDKKYTESIENLIPTNTKAFFDYTKSLKKSKKLPSKMKLNNMISDNPEHIANLFAAHFESVYSPPDHSTELCNLQCNCTNYFEILNEHIILAINSLDQNKTNSPDHLPNIFYKKTMNNLLTPLQLLFNNSLHHRVFPTQ